MKLKYKLRYLKVQRDPEGRHKKKPSRRWCDRADASGAILLARTSSSLHHPRRRCHRFSCCERWSGVMNAHWQDERGRKPDRRRLPTRRLSGLSLQVWSYSPHAHLRGHVNVLASRLWERLCESKRPSRWKRREAPIHAWMRCREKRTWHRCDAELDGATPGSRQSCPGRASTWNRRHRHRPR